jgi:hypothetical protein
MCLVHLFSGRRRHALHAIVLSVLVLSQLPSYNVLFPSFSLILINPVVASPQIRKDMLRIRTTIAAHAQPNVPSSHAAQPRLVEGAVESKLFSSYPVEPMLSASRIVEGDFEDLDCFIASLAECFAKNECQYGSRTGNKNEGEQ